MLKNILAALTLVMTIGQFASADIFLNVGDSVNKNGEMIYCGAATPGNPGQQSATERICQKYDYYNKCTAYNERTLTGRFCIQGQVCQKYDYYNKCVSYDTTAACGNRGCTTSKECQKYDYYNKCVSFDIKVSCN